MDKKYTSLENTIRNVVRGNTGAAQNNRSLESKIRSVVLTESMVGYTAASERTENGHRAIVKDSKGQTRYAGGSEYPTKRHAINGANIYIRNGGGEDGSDMERDYNKQVMFQTHVEEVELDEARRSAASLGFISTKVQPGHGVTASSESYGDSHLPVVTTSSGKRIDVGHKPYPTSKLAQQGAQTFIDNTYTRQGTDPVRGFSALAEHHRKNAKIASSETMKKEGFIITSSGRKPLINEAGLEEGSAKFAKIMARTAARQGWPIITDTTELEKKHNELLQTSRDAADRAKQARTDYETLAKKYGITPEPIGEEVDLDEDEELDADDIRRKYSAKARQAPEAAPEPEKKFSYTDGKSVTSTEAEMKDAARKAFMNRAVGAIASGMKEENQLNELSPGLLTRAADAASDRYDATMKDSEINAALGGGSVNPVAQVYLKMRNKFRQGIKDAATRDRVNAIGISPAVQRKAGITLPTQQIKVSEALGTGGNEGGEFKGTPPAFFKPFHVEPKVGDSHPAAKSSASVARDRAKIASSETMNNSQVKEDIIPNQSYTPPTYLPGNLPTSTSLSNMNSSLRNIDSLINQSANKLYLNKHRAGERKKYGKEIHTESADSERMDIENVTRPNSKSRLARQGEIERKILEDTARRKNVILRAKEESKNDRDGANPDVDTKPELKHVHVHEEDGVLAKTGRGLSTANRWLGHGLGAGFAAYNVGAYGKDAYDSLQQGNYGDAAVNAGLGASMVTRYGPAAYMTKNAVDQWNSGERTKAATSAIGAGVSALRPQLGLPAIVGTTLINREIDKSNDGRPKPTEDEVMSALKLPNGISALNQKYATGFPGAEKTTPIPNPKPPLPQKTSSDVTAPESKPKTKRNSLPSSFSLGGTTVAPSATGGVRGSFKENIEEE